ncbi:unnamed protein product [Prorocentrum cordatum]|uniref:Uncharacterized protein n=1 Tax=Prorocentrum cordatum TaxID=2364126 RepID=A0ABN9RHK3_9DINO|nr:unnamed protein product [Polarella glacialis]
MREHDKDILDLLSAGGLLHSGSVPVEPAPLNLHPPPAMALVLPDFSAKVVRETLNLSDGTTLEVTKPPGTDDLTWKETMQYYEANPEEARRGENAVKDEKAIRDTLQMHAILDYYNSRASEADPAPEILKLEENPDLAHVFEDIRADGSQAAMRYYYNEPLMLKFNRLAGGLPEEVTSILEQIQRSPVTIQEAAKLGDERAVAGYISAGNDVEAADSKGVTILGYAIGANRTKAGWETFGMPARKLKARSGEFRAKVWRARPRRPPEAPMDGLHQAAGAAAKNAQDDSALPVAPLWFGPGFEIAGALSAGGA